MDRLTIAQRLKIVKTYYKNGDSATATYRALRGDYGLHNRPTTQAIGKTVKKLEETGSVTDIVRPVHHRFARTTENIAAASENSKLPKMTDKPKRPLSAYMLWLNSAREQIKKENPGIKVTEVAKRGGELWRAMKDKSEWDAKAAKCKEDYEEAVREFEAGGGGSGTNGNTKKRGKPAKKPAKKTKVEVSEDDDESD